MESAPQLEYSITPPTFWQRRGMRWLLIALGLLLTGGVVLVMNGTSLRRTFEAKRRLWDDRRRYYETAAEAMPAEHVVWDRAHDHGQPTMDPPGRFELLWNPTWRSSLSLREPVVFQHEMTTASGMRVLVAVQFDAYPAAKPELVATMLRPGTLKLHPLRYGPFVVFENDGLLDRQLKLFAGQVDPSDERHFTIRYETPSETGVLDGRMEEDPGATAAYREFGTIRMRRIPDSKFTTTKPS